MEMEIDIDLNIKIDPSATDKFSVRVPDGYASRRISGKGGREGDEFYSIQYADSGAKRVVDNNIDVLIMEFLRGLVLFKEITRCCESLIRLGIYADVGGAVIFSMVLNKDCIQLMADFGVSLDATGYPCN